MIHLTPRIKNSNVLNVFSFFGTEYDQFFSKYNWDTLENMLRYLLVDDEYHSICPIDLTGHLFKKFKKFKSVIPIFYPNIVTDLKDIDDYDSCFNMYYWFYWVKGCHAYPSYYEDSITNYNDIVNIYKTIEKFYYADKNKTATEIDETLEEQSWRSWLG